MGGADSPTLSGRDAHSVGNENKIFGGWHFICKMFFDLSAWGKNKILPKLKCNPREIGDVNAIPLILSLTATNCNPVLMYGLDACLLSSAQISSLAYAYNAVFCKIFKSFDRNIISNCQYYTGTLPLKYAYDLGRLRLLASFHNAIGTPAGFLYKFYGGRKVSA